MTNFIDAVYERGTLRLLEDVPLHDGQKVRIMLESIEPSETEELTMDRARHLLQTAGVLLKLSELTDEELAGEILSDDELDTLVQQTAGGRSTLDMINEDRGAY